MMNDQWRMNVTPEQIKAVKTIVKGGFYRDNNEGKIQMIQELINKLCELDGIPAASVVVGTTSGGFGSYNTQSRTITIQRPSIITAIHEYRHHWQFQEVRGGRVMGNMMTKEQKETDAVAFSASLFEASCPRMFQSSVSAGKVKFFRITESGVSMEVFGA